VLHVRITFSGRRLVFSRQKKIMCDECLVTFRNEICIWTSTLRISENKCNLKSVEVVFKFKFKNLKAIYMELHLFCSKIPSDYVFNVRSLPRCDSISTGIS
jgi:hypothetical protein